MQLQSIAVTGASGLVGTAFCNSLEKDGLRVLRLVRGAINNPTSELAWDPTRGKIDSAALEGIDGVVHLAGANIAQQRWTPGFKRQIVASRIESSRLLAGTLAALRRPPRVLVQASAIGFYGDRGDEVMTEASPPGRDFLADTCVAWESEARPAWEAGVRVVQLRIGVVMARSAGALSEALPKFRLGAGAVLGDGAQWMSWVALDDVVGALRFCLQNDALHGAVNGVAPNPVTNREFTLALAGAVRRPALLKLPPFAVRWIFGEMGQALLLASTRVAPEKLLEAGYTFREPLLRPLLDRLVAH